MSPLVGLFFATLISSLLYNKFDANSRTATTRRNTQSNIETSNNKRIQRDKSKVDENMGDDIFENVSELDVCIFTVSGHFFVKY